MVSASPKSHIALPMIPESVGSRERVRVRDRVRVGVRVGVRDRLGKNGVL